MVLDPWCLRVDGLCLRRRPDCGQRFQPLHLFSMLTMATISPAFGEGGRSARIAIVVAFFVVLALPLLETALPVVPMQPVIENRTLASWPSYDASKGLQKYLEE